MMDFTGYWVARNGQIVKVIKRRNKNWEGIVFIKTPEGAIKEYPLLLDAMGCAYEAGNHLDIMTRIRSTEDKICPDWLRSIFNVADTIADHSDQM